MWAAHGPLLALRGLHLELADGALGALIGANGSGKSSTLQAIAGVLPLRDGAITFRGARLDGAAPEQLVRAGVALVSKELRLFAALTVAEHLRLGAYVRRDAAAIERDAGRVFELFPVLRERATQRAGLLSGGEQQMLAIGMALLSRPQLLLLDEPSTGLAPTVVQEIFAAIRAVHDEGVTVLLAEQQVQQALAIADVGFVLVGGAIEQAAPASELLGDDAVRRSYLGH